MPALGNACRAAYRVLSELRDDGRAVAATEFAVILPVALFLVAGITEAGRYFVVYNSTNRLATQYAASWADCSDVPTGSCASELSTYSSSTVIANIAPKLKGANVTLYMFQVIMNGSTPSVVSAYPSGATMSAAQVASAQAAFTSGQSGVVVTMSYAHTLDFFSSIMSSSFGSALNMSFTVAQLKS